MPFDVTNRATWPELLTIQETAQILRRTPGALRKAVYTPGFQPVPFQKGPMLWRKADLVRHLDSPRGHLRRAG